MVGGQLCVLKRGMGDFVSLSECGLKLYELGILKCGYATRLFAH